MKTLIISSSLSPKSRSYVLCSEMETRLKKHNVEVTLFDARTIELQPTHKEKTPGMIELSKLVEEADSIIFGMGVHNYSVNDSLKIILDTCCSGAENKFFGILCAAGGFRSYLSTMHLTQICMFEYHMMQYPKTIYAAKPDYDSENKISNEDILERLDTFAKEFSEIGKKLLS